MSAAEGCHRMVDMINQRMQNAAPQRHQVKVERSELAKAILVSVVTVAASATRSDNIKGRRGQQGQKAA